MLTAIVPAVICGVQAQGKPATVTLTIEGMT